MPTEVIQFRNKPILKITSDTDYVKVQVGVKKARLILKNIEAIQKFVDENKDG